MADDFTTPDGREAVLIDTADYDVNRDAAAARRRVKALRGKLASPSSMTRDGQSLTFQLQLTERDLLQTLAFLRSVDAPTDAQRRANPSVTHADFSSLRGYSP